MFIKATLFGRALAEKAGQAVRCNLSLLLPRDSRISSKKSFHKKLCDDRISTTILHAAGTIISPLHFIPNIIIGFTKKRLMI